MCSLESTPSYKIPVVYLMEHGFISQEMKGQFHFCVEKSGVFHGFTAWFTVHFESLETGGAMVELNTGPNSEYETPKLNSNELN